MAKLTGSRRSAAAPGGPPLNVVQDIWKALAEASGGLQALGQIVTFAGMLFGVWRVVRGARQPAMAVAVAGGSGSGPVTTSAPPPPRRWTSKIVASGVTDATPLPRLIAL